MYRNKKDVDKHVDGLLKKLSPKEFKSRAYSIARLYYDVGDYSNCTKYVNEYLAQKDNNAAAQKLLGQALLKLGNKDKALEHFITSLEIDPTQTSLILDICELSADNQVEIDFAQASYWCEKAQAVFPRHPATFRLRERLVSLNKSDPDAVEKLLKTQVAENPKDIFLHSRLLKCFLNNNKIKDAFDYSYKVEFESDTFTNNFAWYESLVDILKQNTHNINDWNYQLFLLTVRERICYLSITETPSGTCKSIVESNELLNLYDQAIDLVAKAGAPAGFGEFHLNLIQHHKGQLAFHIATYLLKKAKKDQLNWKDASKLAATFFLISFQTAPLHPKANWLSHAPEKQKQAVLRWYLEGSFRCSNSGHYLVSNLKDKSQIFLDNFSQTCSDTNWRDKLYGKIFTSKEHQVKSKTSFLVSKFFNPPIIKLPRKSEVTAYDFEAQRYYASSIHHMIWILLNYLDFSQFQCSLFEMLKPSTVNNGPESLNKLDVDAFLYCAALTAKQKRSTEVHHVYDKPCILPANITELQCTLPQMKWWVIALKFAQNQIGSDWTDVRTTLSRGIEVVRCLDNHGLDPELLCKLGHIFNERAKHSTAASEKSDLKARAAVYYNEAIPLLEKFKNKIFIKVPEKRMFDYTHKDLSEKDVILLLQEAKLCVAINYFNDSEYEKTIEVLSNLKSPTASYYLARTYLKIALEELNTSNDKFKHGTLLSKAKSYADEAFSQVKTIDDNNLCSDIQDLIETIETHLNNMNIDLSANNVHNDVDDDNSPDEHYYSVDTTSRKNMYTMHRNISSTPKQNNVTKYRSAVDSNILENYVDYQFLERIENQIKSLQRRDTTINDFMDQTKDWFDENRKLGNQIMNTIQSNIQNTTDQFRLLKISVDQIKDQLDECKNECKDVSDLKKQISELKKEVNKLKKTSSEQTIDDSDLYNLDEDYRTSENNINLPFNPAQVMPSFNQRILPTFPMPPNPYQLYGQNMYNLYNQYSQFSQPPSVPAAPQVFDPSRTSVNYAGIYPTPEQLYLDVAHLVPPTVQPPTSVPLIPTGIPTIPPVPTLPAVSTVTIPVVSKPAAQANPPVHKPTPLESRDKKSLPVNVVITSSDPLPTRATTAPAPVLSVTIPPKHIKGTPHNYQIPLPPTDENGISVSMFSQPCVVKSTTTTASATINWNPVTIFKSNQSKPAESSLNISQSGVSVVDGIFSPNTSINKSRTLSEKSNTSIENYDPCPDFKPIVPLPDEVKVTTGEEEESIIFSARAKLFRFVNKEWKERGLGEMKLLKHKVTGKVRVLMRREQIHKICANHLITSDMEIKPMSNETKAYFWVANDFADEKVVLEKFCIRFKTAEIANDFYEEFEKARKEASIVSQCQQEIIKSVPKKITITENTKQGDLSQSNNLSFGGFRFNAPIETNSTNKQVVGGFTFTSAPTFKPVIDEQTSKTDAKQESSKTKLNVFDNLTFKTSNNLQSPFSNIVNKSESQGLSYVDNNSSKINTSDTVEEFEPNVEFEPVIPLPALVDQKTGEEEEIVLFEHRAKLLRFDNPSKEWKERGLGNMKLLMHKVNQQKIRLLMRREQIMKVCCNHVITKDMSFQKMPNMDKAVTWCAKDYSDGELVAETFCLRFKTVQTCDEFIEAIKSAQIRLKDESKAAKEVENAAKQSNQSGFGDKFKPKAGSWHCDSCYTNNLETFLKCACCEQPKHGSCEQPETSSAGDVIFNKAPTVTGWGDKFKPKAGTWECQQCLIRNDSAADNCSACNAARDPLKPKTENSTVSANAPKFNFGIPTTNTLKDSNNKPNTGSTFAPAKPFSFGITAEPVPSGVVYSGPTASIFDGTGAHKFSFGVPPNTQDKSSAPPYTATIFASPKEKASESPINFSLKKEDEKKVNDKPALLSTPVTASQSTLLGDKNTSGFGFVFKPKTSPKGKSPGKSPLSPKGDESDGNEYASEDEGHHIHFNPVIPLPDKVEVLTGEENENELYGHRAKLFVFTAGEWKERGIGIVKILKHKENGKLRVVMRREQVLKICLNHSLSEEITYKPKDDKTWLFAANDYSEGELNLQQFCLRFKTKEIAEEFKNAVDSAQSGKVVQNEGDGEDNTSDEVVFVSETQASAEDKQKAKDLQLPENFFTYKEKVPCQGCRGCKEEEEDTVQKIQIKPPTLLNKILSTATSTPVRYTPPVESRESFAPGTPASGDKTFAGDTSVYRTPLGSTLGFLNSKQTTPSNSSFVSSTSDTTDKENSAFPKTNLFQTAQKSICESTPSSIFGSPQTPNNPSSVADQTKPADPKSVFSFFTQNNSGSIFANNNTGNKTPFTFSADTKSVEPKPEIKSIFGSNSKESSNLFGGLSQGSIFVGGLAKNPPNAPSESIFGTSKFGSIGQFTDTKTENKTDIKEPLLNVDSDLSFSSLATKGNCFTKKEDFKWEGEGQKLFGGVKKTEAAAGEDEEGAPGDEEYDPHYEPIVPLPDKIVVTTGEEDEVKVFSERCKLFRFDEKTREWKERGVGELKILHHVEKNTFRLLLRREQVHKAVLNMLLNMDMEFLPMKNSESAWTWAGYNYAENPSGEKETLAVRFKSIPLAKTFLEKATECIRKLQAAAAQAIRDKEQQPSTAAAPLRLPKHLQDSARADADLSQKVAQHTQAATLQTQTTVSTEANEASDVTRVTSSQEYTHEADHEDHEDHEDEEDDEYEYEHNEDYDYYNEEEEESTTYYSCEGSVTVRRRSGVEVNCDNALVQVSFDPEIYSPKILISDAATGEILSDMLIHTDTEFKMSGDSCSWSGVDYTSGAASENAVSVHFPDSDTAMNFYDSCETSKAATYSSTDPES